MFYEEAIIQGCLCWRNTPNGTWIKFSQRELSKKHEGLMQAVFWGDDALRHGHDALMHVDAHITDGEPLDHGKIQEAIGKVKDALQFMPSQLLEA